MTEISTMSYGGVNCYLIRSGDYFAMVDTGYARHRDDLVGALDAAGCQPGKLKLVVVTHGDPDHCGNAGFLREKYRAGIAMHHDELEAVEQGDMLANRKRHTLAAALVTPLFNLRPVDRFKPNIVVRDGDWLNSFKLDAEIVHIPGHSTGSIGVLTAERDLFCGDLFTNTNRPTFNSLIDDKEAAAASLEKLRALPIRLVYPGRGAPFEMAEILGEKV